MAETSTVVFRERPLHEVKSEITRRAAHLNPLDGIRAEDAERVKNALTSLDRDEWAREWSRFGFEYEAQADALEKSGGDTTKCRELYELAFHNFRVGRYPCAGSPGQAQAYRDSVRVFRKAARYFDTPMEIIEVPFGDKRLTGYLQIPKGVDKPPVMLHWGGVDGWKEDRQRSHARFNSAGIAGFAIDMPGTGESPITFTDADATRSFSVLIDYLHTRKDIDATRLAVWGGSYGGYWAAKLAYVEAKRLKGAVFHGSNVHYGFQESWLRPALTEKASAAIFGPIGLFQARSKAMGVKTLEEFLRVAPALSLKTQGLLDQPSAPLLAVNGKLDDQAPVEDIYLLMEHGNPKEARIYPEGGHMGRSAGVKDEEIANMIVSWLKMRLAQ
jgi:pimeloyl-ACP methyl ester carboxylesterase